MSESKNVYQLIAEVTAKMAKEGISKDRKNQQQGYNFRGIDDVYNVLGSMLGEVGLVIIPRVVGRDVIERQTKSGGALFYVVTDVEYDLISSHDSSKHVAKVMGEAMDSADKATNKAMSAAYKYLCLQTFCIPTEGDNDADGSTHVVAPKVDPITPERKAFIIELVGKETDVEKVRALYKAVQQECKNANDESAWNELKKVLTEKATQLQPPQENMNDTTN